MKKILTLLTVLIVCFGCSSKTKEEASPSTLFVENGVVKYNNNGSIEDVVLLEELLDDDDEKTIVEAKEIELAVKDGYIVWNYTGETAEYKLIAIKDLMGEKGETGKQGPKGETGEQGATGAKGDTGATGAQGAKGDKGETGAQGPKGEQGLQGEKGDQGEDGANAYIWIRYAETDPLTTTVTISETPNNYMGVYSGNSSTAPTDADEYNWFKIKGEQGDKGDAGATGAQGLQGIQGPQGQQGEKGDKGDRGDAGVTIESYYDNLAIVTCPFYLHTDGYQIKQKACSLDYKGVNVDIEVKDGQDDDYLATIDQGAYLFETEMDFSYEATENSANKYIAITRITLTGNDIREKRKNIDKDAKEAKIFAVNRKTVENKGDLRWSTGFEGINIVDGIMTFKIHKIR